MWKTQETISYLQSSSCGAEWGWKMCGMNLKPIISQKDMLNAYQALEWIVKKFWVSFIPFKSFYFL